MGVALAVGEGVVLAVYRHPLLTALAGGEPEHRPTGELRRRVESQGPVRQTPMQVDRGDEHGHLRQGDGNKDDQYDVQGVQDTTVWWPGPALLMRGRRSFLAYTEVRLSRSRPDRGSPPSLGRPRFPGSSASWGV